MKHAKDMDLRDMLDEVAFELSGYESEMGTKQSFNYDVSVFIKQLILGSYVCLLGETFLQEVVLQSRH